MDAPGEVWQVTVNGEIYDADIETLKQWIVEGAVQPEDKVRRGKLNWLEAGRVPILRAAFTGAEPISQGPPAASYPVVPDNLVPTSVETSALRQVDGGGRLGVSG